MRYGITESFYVVSRESLERCSILLDTIKKCESHPDVEKLVKSSKESLLALQKSILTLMEDETVKDPRFFVNFMIKLSSIVANLQQIQVEPITIIKRYDERDEQKTTLVSKALHEMNYPFEPPLVVSLKPLDTSCIPKWNIIYTPPCQQELLSFFPDILHEVGHIVWYMNQDILSIDVLNPVKSYFEAKLNEVNTRRRGSRNLLQSIKKTRILWEQYWIKEFFSDIFATLVSGASYGWSHFRYSIGAISSIYSPSNFDDESFHPSDASRMTVISQVLDYLHPDLSPDSVFDHWEFLLDALRSKGLKEPVTHRVIFPDALLEEIVHISLHHIQQLGILNYVEQFTTKKDCITAQARMKWETFQNDIP